MIHKHFIWRMIKGELIEISKQSVVCRQSQRRRNRLMLMVVVLYLYEKIQTYNFLYMTRNS